MEISTQEFYETCSTDCLEYMLLGEITGEHKRIIRDILETRNQPKDIIKCNICGHETIRDQNATGSCDSCGSANVFTFMKAGIIQKEKSI